MLEIPVIRWGQPYESVEKQPVVHFETGEELARSPLAIRGLLELRRNCAVAAGRLSDVLCGLLRVP